MTFPDSVPWSVSFSYTLINNHEKYFFSEYFQEKRRQIVIQGEMP